MLFSSALALLRRAHHALGDLPDSISLPKHPAREAKAPVALKQRRHCEFDFSFLDQALSACRRRDAVVPSAAAGCRLTSAIIH